MSKKERTIVKVDEDKVRRMIAGDEPYLQATPADKKKESDDRAEVFGEDAPESNSLNDKLPTEPGRRRKSKNDYAGIFLNTTRDYSKKQTTILLTESLFEKMEMLIGATRGVSMGLFINNVLAHHFEEYEDDINAIKAKYIEKLSKKM